MCQYRADSRLAPSQWETSLQSNAVSHWLGANLESALQYIKCGACNNCCMKVFDVKLQLGGCKQASDFNLRSTDTFEIKFELIMKVNTDLYCAVASGIIGRLGPFSISYIRSRDNGKVHSNSINCIPLRSLTSHCTLEVTETCLNHIAS